MKITALVMTGNRRAILYELNVLKANAGLRLGYQFIFYKTAIAVCMDNNSIGHLGINEGIYA